MLRSRAIVLSIIMLSTWSSKSQGQCQNVSASPPFSTTFLLSKTEFQTGTLGLWRLANVWAAESAVAISVSAFADLGCCICDGNCDSND